MTEQTVSSRQFNHDPSGAKRAAGAGPVLITHRGEVSHVLLSARDYRRLSGGGQSLAEMLGMEGGDTEEGDFDFEPSRSNVVLRPVDLS